MQGIPCLSQSDASIIDRSFILKIKGTILFVAASAYLLYQHFVLENTSRKNQWERRMFLGNLKNDLYESIKKG